MTKTQLIAAALDLPKEDRADVLVTLLHSLDGSAQPALTDEQWKNAWGVELDKRVEEIERGDVEVLSAQEVFAEGKRRLAMRNGRGS